MAMFEVTFVFLSGLWGTRMTENPKNREQYVKTTIRELIVYIFFLVDLCLCESNFLKCVCVLHVVGRMVSRGVRTIASKLSNLGLNLGPAINCHLGVSQARKFISTSVPSLRWMLN